MFQRLKEEEGKWILDTMVTNMAGVGRFVIGLAGDIKIVDSPLLKVYVETFVEKYLKA